MRFVHVVVDSFIEDSGGREAHIVSSHTPVREGPFVDAAQGKPDTWSADLALS